MEILKFIVTGQHIKKDPSSPFNKMVAGTSNYYAAKFEMNEAWNGYACLAQFKAGTITENVPIIKGSASIPASVLAYKNFTVQVIGKKNDSYLTTDLSKIMQIGGK